MRKWISTPNSCLRPESSKMQVRRYMLGQQMLNHTIYPRGVWTHVETGWWGAYRWMSRWSGVCTPCCHSRDTQLAACECLVHRVKDYLQCDKGWCRKKQPFGHAFSKATNLLHTEGPHNPIPQMCFFIQTQKKSFSSMHTFILNRSYDSP